VGLLARQRYRYRGGSVARSTSRRSDDDGGRKPGGGIGWFGKAVVGVFITGAGGLLFKGWKKKHGIRTDGSNGSKWTEWKV
jgi:hypothetical protein